MKTIHYHMNTKIKELYETPETRVIEVKIESTLLQTSNYNYGNIDESNESLTDEQGNLFMLF